MVNDKMDKTDKVEQLGERSGSQAHANIIFVVNYNHLLDWGNSWYEYQL